MLTRLTVGFVTDANEQVVGYVFVFSDLSEIAQTNEELKEKLKEIEKMNRLMVGRELRMHELKKKIKKLEGK